MVGQSWRERRWHSLRLLTPNWMNRLPGRYDIGDDPDDYLGATEVVDLLDGYARSFAAPVLPRTTVVDVRRRPRGSAWTPTAARGAAGPSSWRRDRGRVADPRARRGARQRPAAGHRAGYREPGQVAPGAVLVVGASASGVQIADELRRAGRSVTLAVGDHVRVPRTYRGRDIYRWLDELGILDERYDEVEDLARARRLPSLQLVGSPQRRSLDLATLSAAAGVSSPGGSSGSPAAAPCSRARWRTSSRRATSSSPGCWTASTHSMHVSGIGSGRSTGRTRRRCPRR